MKHKTADLEGALLDAAVAKAEGMLPVPESLLHATIGGQRVQVLTRNDPPYAPSRSWADGGPIIERERITLTNGLALGYGEEREFWEAACSEGRDAAGDLIGSATREGETPLIAAMRAYISSKFGEEVELP